MSLMLYRPAAAAAAAGATGQIRRSDSHWEYSTSLAQDWLPRTTHIIDGGDH